MLLRHRHRHAAQHARSAHQRKGGVGRQSDTKGGPGRHGGAAARLRARLGAAAEEHQRQGHDHHNQERSVQQHGRAPAEGGHGAFEQRRPQCAREIAAARNQRQRRTAAAVEPVADVDVHRRIDGADAEQPYEERMADPERSGRAQGRDRKADADHHRAEDDGRPHAEAVGDASHEHAADARPEPGQRCCECGNGPRPAYLRCDSVSATDVIQPAPKTRPMMPSATTATTQDCLVSTEATGGIGACIVCGPAARRCAGGACARSGIARADQGADRGGRTAETQRNAGCEQL